jgi:SRSO17 transposase
MIWKSWTGFASIETTLEVLASSLPSVQGRMRSLFVEERSAMNAGLFLDGLLSEVRRRPGGAQELARRVSLVMLAFDMTAAIRHQVNRPVPNNGSRRSQKMPEMYR